MHVITSLIGLATAALVSVESHMKAIGEKFARLANHPAAAPELREALPSIEATLQAHSQAIRALTEAVDQLHQAQQPPAQIFLPRLPAPPVLTPSQVAAVDETHDGAPSSSQPA